MLLWGIGFFSLWQDSLIVGRRIKPFNDSMIRSWNNFLMFNFFGNDSWILFIDKVDE